MSEAQKGGIGLKPLELLADTPMLLTNSKETGKIIEVPVSSVIEADTTVCFYFSASWCPPCVRFTPGLVDVYEKLKANGKKVQICFVSLDRDTGSFENYFRKMSFLAIPRQDPTIRRLTTTFQVQSIPKLLVVGPDGRTLNHNAVQAVGRFGAAGFPCSWEEEEASQQEMSGSGSSFFFTILLVLLVLLLPYLNEIRGWLGF